MGKSYFDNMPAVDIAALKESLGLNEEGDPTDFFYTKAQVEALLLTVENPVLRDLKTLGSPALAVPLGSSQVLASTGSALTDGRCNIILFRLEKETIITGFKGLLTTLGDYTADNYNGFAIHSVSGSTATRIAETVNDGELWKSAAITKALPTPLTLQAGLYAVTLLFNASVSVIAPVLSYFGAANGMSHGIAKISSYINLQSTIPESITLTGNVTGSIIWGIYLY